MEKTLKDLLKPPFKLDSLHGERYIYDDRGFYLLAITDLGLTKKIRGEIKRFVLQGINNEWERQYGEPKRWMYNDTETDCMYYCPACKVGADDLLEYHFCFRCGVQLLPPDWEEQYKPYQTKPDKSSCPDCLITDCICLAEGEHK